MKTFLLLLPMVLSTAFAAPQSKVISTKDLEKIETEVQSKLQSSLVDDKKKFFVNLLAGRELYQYRFYDKSKKYYQDAIKLNVKENKAEAYINLMAIALNDKDQAELKAGYEAAKKYFADNSKYKTQDIEYYLSAIEKSLSGKGEVPGFYGYFAEESNLIELIKNKEFEKGLSAINPDAIKQSQDSFNIIAYDTLNVAVNKKNVKELYCAPEYKKYPNAYTYSIILCGLLSDYLKQGKFDQKKLARAQTYFKEENQEKKYLLEAVEGIK
ncbi:hypothetical protein DOM21_11825 [Bacteriovorax stolpii]|uniref:Uncharacterized protein n=1 Tax=Bacteriovorax stolpii TaxID=960 RepID=A0A2K9NQW1_BACTC|nr:hypothetical protein [Bacteriovorax stolpii]AUN97891.1 hypothetical protein C0V70_07175 [Bacteriovorax stolpii]QDK42123.1 hypothetical protein DOM21_11825 [Bacteriovorax stolpii]TDP51722.1 hypothetical protein C8D79_3167 [Bacteriovorax stolpii]